MNHKGLNRFTSTPPLTIYKTKSQKFTDQDPGTTQPEGNFIHLNYKFFFFLTLKIFPVLVVNSLCKNIFLIFFSKFPVFSLSGKMDFQNPLFSPVPWQPWDCEAVNTDANVDVNFLWVNGDATKGIRNEYSAIPLKRTPSLRTKYSRISGLVV